MEPTKTSRNECESFPNMQAPINFLKTSRKATTEALVKAVQLLQNPMVFRAVCVERQIMCVKTQDR